jgi:sulfur-carrier protein adenylyltransferase/sulfurtransferase
MSLSKNELKRYSRHLILSEVGLEGQEKLKNSKVLIVGAGGLGCPLATYLVAAGVGGIGIIDFDVVDESNLQRQVLYGVDDIGKSKVEVAKQKLLNLNPHITVDTYNFALTTENALDLFSNYDVIADGTDNFSTRYLVNDACVLTNKPNVYGSIFRFEGQVSVFNYNDGPNYRCLFKEPPPPGLVPSCAEGGVLGVLPGVIATLQATEVIKVLLNLGDIASGRLLIYDALKLKFRELPIKKRNDYEIKSLINYDQFCGVDTMQNNSIQEITVQQLNQKIKEQESLTVLDVRESFEYDICHLDNSTLIPLSQFEDNIESLDKNKNYVVLCKLGGRSAKAVQMMHDLGFLKVKNLKGGIITWAEKIDQSMSIY